MNCLNSLLVSVFGFSERTAAFCGYDGDGALACELLRWCQVSAGSGLCSFAEAAEMLLEGGGGGGGGGSSAVVLLGGVHSPQISLPIAALWLKPPATEFPELFQAMSTWEIIHRLICNVCSSLGFNLFVCCMTDLLVQISVICACGGLHKELCADAPS